MTGHPEVDENRDAPDAARRKKALSANRQERTEPNTRSKTESVEIGLSTPARLSETERELAYTRLTEEARKRLREKPQSEEVEDDYFLIWNQGFRAAVEEERRLKAQEQAEAAEKRQALETTPPRESPKAQEIEGEKKEESKGPFPKSLR